MDCRDNSHLKIPLSEVCEEIEIGCVPQTKGKPEWTPLPDQLPIAHDPEEDTLWMYDCSQRIWRPLRKFRLCDLEEVSLNNLQDICNVLRIPVFYGLAQGCTEGHISVEELAAELWECWDWDDDITSFEASCVDDHTLKLTIKEPKNDKEPGDEDEFVEHDMYFEVENLKVECGDGTEGHPIKIIANDPICEWPEKPQGTIENAVNLRKTIHLGACLEGEPVRVPPPKNICQFDKLTREETEAAANIHIGACVDDEVRKIPLPRTICELDQLTREETEAATNISIGACIDGKLGKIPLPRTICELPTLTQEQVDAEDPVDILVAACVGGEPSKIPQTPYKMCVDEITDIPVDPPGRYELPFKVTCCGQLYVWTCNGEWIRVMMTPDGLPEINLDCDPIFDQRKDGTTPIIVNE